MKRKNTESISDKKIPLTMRLKGDVPYLFSTTDNLMHCRECEARLSFWRMIFHAVGKKKGDAYKVPCRKCGYINSIVKGQMGEELDKRWE